MITFDLDDTLWDNRPTIIKAEIDTRKWIEDKVGKVEWGDFNDFLELREELIKEDESIQEKKTDIDNDTRKFKLQKFYQKMVK